MADFNVNPKVLSLRVPQTLGKERPNSLTASQRGFELRVQSLGSRVGSTKAFSLAPDAQLSLVQLFACVAMRDDAESMRQLQTATCLLGEMLVR